MRHNDEHETITVYMSYKGDRKVHPFYCCRCAKCICEITGEATTIIPGEPDQVEMNKMGAKLIIKCGGGIYFGKDQPRLKCTAKYIFN